MIVNDLSFPFFYRQDCKKLKMLQDCSSILKASVHVQKCEPYGQSVIVKDFSHSPLLLRKTLCRLFLNREIKALKRLKNIDGIPKFLGHYGKYGFVMSLIEGRHPNKQQFKHSKTLENQLQILLKNMHKAGVTHNDVRMKNIIISNNNELFMIDYASAFMLGDKSSFLYYLKLPLYLFLKLVDESRVVNLSVSENSCSTNLQDRNIFRVIRKLHIVVDGWKYLRKLFRKK